MATVTLTQRGTITVPDSRDDVLAEIERSTFGKPPSAKRTPAEFAYNAALAERLKQIDPEAHRLVFRTSPAKGGGLSALKSLTRSRSSASDIVRATDDTTRKAATVTIGTRCINPETLDLRRSTRSQETAAGLELIERAGDGISSDRKAALEELFRSDEPEAVELKRRALITERDPYKSAFEKYVRSVADPVWSTQFWSSAEKQAVSTWREETMRAASDAGSFGLAAPVFIDPTISPSSGELAPVAAAAHVVNTIGDQWKGVVSAAPTFEWLAEGVANADDTPTLVQSTIPIYTARSWVPGSFEVMMDYPDFAGEFGKHLEVGFLDALSAATVSGSGVASPTGLFTAMAATTTSPSHVTVTTLGTISGVDVRKAWAAVPQRFRPTASWVMHESVLNQIRGTGNNLALSDLTTDPATGTVRLFGRPVISSDYAPAFTGTTGTANYAVVGDIGQGYTVAVRAGLTVEVVQEGFDQATFRPTMQRGLLAYARFGANVSVPNSIRLLSNT